MAERQQEPFDKLLQFRPVEPFFEVERLGMVHGFIDMGAELVDNCVFASDEDDLVHIAERAVVEIRRTDGEELAVDQDSLGVEVTGHVVPEFQPPLVQRPDIAVTEDIDKHYVGMARHHDSDLNATFARIQESFTQEISGEEIGSFDFNAGIGMAYHLDKFLIDPFLGDGRDIADDQVIAVADQADVGVFLEKIAVIDFEVEVKHFFKRCGDIAFHPEHQLSPFEAVFRHVARTDPANVVVDDQQFTMVAAVVFGKEVDDDPYFAEESHLSPQVGEFPEVIIRNVCAPGIDQQFDLHAPGGRLRKRFSKPAADGVVIVFIDLEVDIFPGRADVADHGIEIPCRHIKEAVWRCIGHRDVLSKDKKQ